MRTVWKYEFPINYVPGEHKFMMPIGAVPLGLQFQDDHLVLWVDCETLNGSRPRTFVFVATGDEVGSGLRYIDTVLDEELSLHLFEKEDFHVPELR